MSLNEHQTTGDPDRPHEEDGMPAGRGFYAQPPNPVSPWLVLAGVFWIAAIVAGVSAGIMVKHAAKDACEALDRCYEPHVRASAVLTSVLGSAAPWVIAALVAGLAASILSRRRWPVGNADA
jgi:hypothetical protein